MCCSVVAVAQHLCVQGKLLDMIRHIWKEYFLAVKTSGRQRSLPRFCFEYFLTSYGLKTLAQQHLCVPCLPVVCSCVQHRLHAAGCSDVKHSHRYVLLYSMKEYRPKLVHTRFETFLSFLGMTLPCSCTITPGGKCSYVQGCSSGRLLRRDILMPVRAPDARPDLRWTYRCSCRTR